MQITIKTPDMTKCVNVEGSTDPFLNKNKPEGMAFSAYISGDYSNPYKKGSGAFKAFDQALSRLTGSSK